MPIEVRTLAEWEATGVPGMLSVVIPAHNEEGHIADTVRGLADTLRRAGIDYEIVVVNDNSNDATERILVSLISSDSRGSASAWTSPDGLADRGASWPRWAR